MEEELPSTIQHTGQKAECEAHRHYHRNSEARSMIKLPFKLSDKKLEDSYHQAKRRLFSIENKLTTNKQLALDYYNFMKEYEALSHMEKNQTEQLQYDQIFYLPHDAVVKLDKTKSKVRVTFDGSAKSSNGKSLNDILLTEPTIQPDLDNILLRFRIHHIATLGDIENMYQQVLVTPEITTQQILWREDPNLPIKTYRLKTATCDISSAPFLAIRSLQQLAEDNQIDHSDIANIILNDFYIDDVLTRANSLEEETKIKNKVITIWSSAGFNLTKWRSNQANLNHKQTDEKSKQSVDLVDMDIVKVLGIKWNPTSDAFLFKVNIKLKTNPTKRNILSEASKIFNPHRWLSPDFVKIKILKKLWIMGTDWDDNLPKHLTDIWYNIISDFHLLEQIAIPRNLSLSTTRIEIHGFCDASESAYAAAVIYLRSVDSTNHVFSQIISAKPKVAPIKQVSLPTLELSGAHLLTQMILSSIFKQRYWSFLSRSLIRQEVRRCVICVLQRAQTTTQIMEDLPAVRVTPSRPFSNVGVDFAGLIQTLQKRTRGAKLSKGYMSVFVCLATKAVHIEAVNQVKYHLLRAVQTSKLTFEELQTILCQIEATLNSRPLWPTSEDLDDLQVSAPGHFLINFLITAVPDLKLHDIIQNQLNHCQKIQQRLQIFWKKYSREYLNQLQQRQKWRKPTENLKPGDIIILKDDNLLPCKWALGRIQEVHPGSDGIVRVITIKTVASDLIK